MELDDVRAATEWLLAHADPDDLARHLRDAAELYRRRSYWAELRTIAEDALDRPDLSSVARAELLGLVGEAHRNVGKPGDAIRLAHRALTTLGRAPQETRSGRLRWMAGHAGTFAAFKVGLVRSEARRDVARVRSERLLSLGELYYIGEQFDRWPPIALGGFVEGHVSARPVGAGDRGQPGGDLGGGCRPPGVARRYVERSTARAGDPRVSLPAAHGARHRGATAALLWADLVWAESAVRLDRLDESAARATHALGLTDRVDARIDRVRDGRARTCGGRAAAMGRSHTPASPQRPTSSQPVPRTRHTRPRPTPAYPRLRSTSSPPARATNDICRTLDRAEAIGMPWEAALARSHLVSLDGRAGRT